MKKWFRWIPPDAEWAKRGPTWRDIWWAFVTFLIIAALFAGYWLARGGEYAPYENGF